MLQRFVSVCVLGVACVTGLGQGDLPITVTQVEIPQPQNRFIRGFVAEIDLTDPRVEIVVTRKRPAGAASEAKLAPTNVWRTRTGSTLAVNANFFGIVSGIDADIVGLSMSDGVQVSPPRNFDGQWDPALVFYEDGAATVDYINAPGGLTGVVDAVAGVGRSNTDTDPGTLLVSDGVNTGATARVQPGTRNPRTAAGVTQDGNTLILAVIDGRQNNWSVGMTLPELADLMIQHGAWDAVNLDGGGSSSFVYDDGVTQHENRPSDGAHRAVANHLGVRLNHVPSAVPDEDRRPVRGAWLRPPGSLAGLEDRLASMRSAGIQDLFLETFYWGLATNSSGVFQPRFGFDYLADAIELSAEYGIRVHAWLESAYWSFSGTGDYILDQHPEWKVVDYLGNTDIGDIPGQVFVNLGHPGVQGMLGQYCAELAGGYPGLWGVQTDYHRFPLDNNTGDSNPGPYSYDAWARGEFQALTGFDPIGFGPSPSGALWDQFTQFRRDGISQAAGVMHDAITTADPGMMFSGAVFASAVSSPSQFVKMQDWPTMAANGWLPHVVPMAYGFSTSSISSDLQTAINQKGPAEVIAGLAILTNASRPSITAQLNAVDSVGLDSFIFFDAETMHSVPAMVTELGGYLASNGPFQTADFNSDGEVDARDWDAFYGAYPGVSVDVSGSTFGLDINNDLVIDADDEHRFLQQFKAFRFGRDAYVDAKDREALLNARTTSPQPTTGRLHLYDLNGDGSVNCLDEARLRSLSDAPLPPSADVNGDGIKDNADIGTFIFYFLAGGLPADFTVDGVLDYGDIGAFVTEFLKGC
ncbi:MAG: phosphodiester glycosidase family protein [Phycisphaerales bacterium JB040]